MLGSLVGGTKSLQYAIGRASQPQMLLIVSVEHMERDEDRRVTTMAKIYGSTKIDLPKGGSWIHSRARKALCADPSCTSSQVDAIVGLSQSRYCSC